MKGLAEIKLLPEERMDTGTQEKHLRKHADFEGNQLCVNAHSSALNRSHPLAKDSFRIWLLSPRGKIQEGIANERIKRRQSK